MWHVPFAACWPHFQSMTTACVSLRVQGTTQVTNSITGGIFSSSAQAIFRAAPIDGKYPPSSSTSDVTMQLINLGNGVARLSLQNATFFHALNYDCAPLSPCPNDQLATT